MPEDEFKKSRWHTRGWTLQELIAPEHVTFVSKLWTVVGNKKYKAELVEKAIGVPVDVLMDPKKMWNYSVAQRMSWAAGRVTTLQEDEAYCLLGIFDINMPTLYGEGRKAFRRLQEEIMRQSPDTTLFAWGPRCTLDHLVHLRAESPDSCEDPDYHLFATSPSSFRGCSRIRFVDPTKCLRQDSYAEQRDGYITFTSTPHGVSTDIPTVTHKGKLLGHLGWVEDRRFLLLLLQQLPSDKGTERYRVDGLPLETFETVWFPHIVYAPAAMNDTMQHRQLAQSEWRKVYLAHEHVIATMKTEDTSVFQTVSPVPEHQHPAALTFDRRSSRLPDVGVTWTGDPPVILAFHSSVASPPPVVHWAHVEFRYWSPDRPIEHDCFKDHISSWPDRSRKIGWRGLDSKAFQVNISFTPLRCYPEHTLVLRLRGAYVDGFTKDCEIVGRGGPSPDRSRSSTPSSICPPLTMSKHASAVIEDLDEDGEIEEIDHAVPAQPSAAVDEPIASSSANMPQTGSSAQGLGWAEWMQLGTKPPKYGHAEVETTLEGSNEDSETAEQNPQWKLPRLPWRNAQKNLFLLFRRLRERRR
ncbi:hypothetical protein C8Q74DRAFT_1308567, partial [Fomes fomentarius]